MIMLDGYQGWRLWVAGGHHSLAFMGGCLYKEGAYLIAVAVWAGYP